MPAPNSLAKIAKKLESLQVKAAKLNSEIAELSAFVAQEAQRAPAPEAEPSAEPKKRGRPRAADKPAAETPAPAKRRGRPAKR
jgi:peptidoglycan hydrolase CwlO-like protein